VAYRKRFVDDQHVGIDVHDNGKSQAHEHSTGIQTYGLIDEVADAGEGDDGIHACIDLGPAETVHGGVQTHVLASTEVRIEASTQLQQRGNTTAALYLTGGGCERAHD